MTEDFGLRLARFVGLSQAKINDYWKVMNYTHSEPPTLVMQEGKKYVKIVRKDSGTNGGSVHCFVDKTNGNVLKAASWASPAKHARGNIFNDDNGADAMTQWGANYLR